MARIYLGGEHGRGGGGANEELAAGDGGSSGLLSACLRGKVPLISPILEKRFVKRCIRERKELG